ncbi:formin-like protein 20 [Syzygium oleosum]|uniref:formin-like protein 20 n=1 Tax=Syzygium oleosum TaxID=219896 RepID=UPI0011D2816A|nr:formin-like protein 20 [Syzygium oleosum]
MGGGEHHHGWGAAAATAAAVAAPETTYAGRDGRWTHFDDSVNAVSFGFVATAILISMFLLMAIFERFLRSRTSSSPSPPPSQTSSDSSPGRSTTRLDVESQMALPHKLRLLSSPKMSVYANGVSVLMPGEQMPTFIAHPAPPPPPPTPPPPPPPPLPPCPREPVSQPVHHQHNHSFYLHCLSRSIGS